MSRPKALVLDFGGVITRTLFETHELTEKALGLPAGTLRWRGPFAPETDPLWLMMQAGEISERDYWLARTREVGSLVGEDWQRMETFVQRARGDAPEAAIRPEAEAAIRTASHAGIRLAILSNELDLFYGADFRAKLPLLLLFEAIIDATYSTILKPDPRSYASVTDTLRLPAEDCVFVDDQRRNIVGAAAAGMRTVHFDVREPQKSFTETLGHFGLALDMADRSIHA
jgi:putative hydrolase of the HAD superfamily